MKLMAITTSAQTLDSMPTERPERMVVAGTGVGGFDDFLDRGFLGGSEVGSEWIESNCQTHTDGGQSRQAPIMSIEDTPGRWRS